MTLARMAGRVVAAALLAFVVGVGADGCSKSPPKSDGGDASIGEGGVDVPIDGRDSGTDMPVCTAAARAIGMACDCKAQCASGFCVDGVCCAEACAGGCKTCAAPNAPGTCVSRTAGATPRDSTTCMTMLPATCGFDGKCDGAGACRKYPVNTMCKPGVCDGDAVVGSNACDGNGQCKPGSTHICVPFSCNAATGSCVSVCTSNSQCVSGHQCKEGSCGPLMIGAICQRNDQCASNFCADGVCCNVACQGPCLSCNLMGREGTCWPIDADQPDPRGICRDMGRSTCGQTGLCDGIGSCSKYARDTECIAPTCSGNRLNTAGTCNGLGSCRPQGLQDCYPYRCAGIACTTSCATSADCSPGIACVNNSCGLRQDGQMCQASSECEHNHCVDGICCDQACGGACRSCALSASLGRCTPIAAGTIDPRGVCTVMPQSTCSSNGKCDGSGGCQNWPVGTLCGDETCNPTGNLYKRPSTCNASGKCEAPDLIPCSPYICNGARCFNACTNNNQCVTPFTCAANSCGLKENGAACSAAAECRSTFCAQGVCCDSACTGACKSCTAGTAGVCSNVATGSNDPAGLCATADPSTCGTNGKCEAGACQRYASGTPCIPATCPTTTNLFTPLSACDGVGVCVTPGTMSCFPYRCGTTLPAACKPSCTANADCLPPAVCTGGFCGLKANGAICANRNECLSGFCEQGVCCQTACTGICKSCALTASAGVCSNIANGTVDVMSRCSDQGAPSCGTDGFCNGLGACRLYGASTPCAQPSCPTGQSTQINGRTCNGLGVCQTATTLACSPYVCDGATACRGTCRNDADCLAPNICDPRTSRCGNKKRLGQPCAATSECLTDNFCTNGVCCSTSACGLCQACNVGTAAGNCANAAVGTTDSRCTASPPCGNTGACNGAGACQLAATSVSCGTASCSGSTFTPVSRCNGSGACAPATPSSCGAYVCETTGCRTNCSMDSHCIAPFTCQGSPPNRSCALKPPGTACTAANQCISGSCVNGVCCSLPAGSTTCPTCQTCAGATGTCTNLATGTTAPAGQCPASAPCGNTGTCTAGACTQGAATVACGRAVSCTTATYQPASTCTGAGTCNQMPTTTCGAYVCGSSTTCRTNCNSDAHCATTSLYCTGNATTAGTCVPKKSNGATCGAANECAAGNCTDGVCCTTSSCAACQSCNVNGSGTCANVANNTADPPNCAASTGCGNTGLCVAGACEQRPASTSCGLAASCTGTTYQPPSNCSGTGTCTQTTTRDCAPYQCGVNACKTTCAGDGDCSAGNYCAGTSCMAKKAAGVACGGANQCINGNCTDGVCCTTSSCPACQSCNVNGSGTCANVPDGMGDPPNCAANGVCGNTGACIAGTCQQQSTTIPCGAAASCMNGMYQPQPFCSGTGTCPPANTTSCGRFLCNAAGTACLTACNNDLDCVSGNYCTGANGSCQAKKTPGTACGAGHECTTSNCVDGVCCNSGGCGTCQTCAGTNPGTCTAIASGPAPTGQCSPNPPCGNTGTCTNGACTQGAAGQMCSGFGCTPAGNFQPAGTCDGSGGCPIPGVTICAPYTCALGGCLVTCSGDAQCIDGHYCNGGSCTPKKALGDTCGRDGECGSAHCNGEGVCCTTGACMACESCRVPGFVGMCHNVPAGGADPLGTCVDQPSTCGNRATCDGAGSCARYEFGAECLMSCDGMNITRSYCDLLGTCTPAPAEICPSTMCTPSGCTPGLPPL